MIWSLSLSRRRSAILVIVIYEYDFPEVSITITRLKWHNICFCCSEISCDIYLFFGISNDCNGFTTSENARIVKLLNQYFFTVANINKGKGLFFA